MMDDTCEQSESMESTESGNNGIKCWCVDGKKETRVKKGQERENSENMKKRGEKKTNKDEKRGWHPNTLSSVFSYRLNSQTHEVEVLGTLHSQTLCVFWQSITTNKRQSENTKQTHGAWVLGFGVVRKTA